MSRPRRCRRFGGVSDEGRSSRSPGLPGSRDITVPTSGGRPGPPFRWAPLEPPPWRDRPGRPWRSHRGPAVFAVVFALVFQLVGAKSAAEAGAVLRPLDLLSVALLVVGPLALLWRRPYPIPVLAVAAAGSIGFSTFAEPRWAYAVAPAIALFSAVRSGRARPALVTAAAGYVTYVLVNVIFADRLHVPEAARPDLRTLIVLAAGLALTAILGGAAKARAEYLAEMAKVRAERARAREEQERRQTSEERLRIARELHDVLGHHLSLINVQAGVGLHLMDSRPEQAREALTAIKTASSEALREVRAVLGVLRPEEEAAPRQPALGLDRLEDLTAGAGIPVTTTIAGTRRPLPAEVDRAAYRIVQEALTNVRRHAPAGSAEVCVSYEPAQLRLSVRNTPAGPPATVPGSAAPAGEPGAGSTTAGSGIAGMRARAEALGGTLEAGPLDGGGFVVSAVLPASGPPANDPGGDAGGST
jgi:signal transduction histidine kinase